MKRSYRPSRGEHILNRIVIREGLGCWIWRGVSSALDETRRYLFEEAFGKIPEVTPDAIFELRRAESCHSKCVAHSHSELWIGLPADAVAVPAEEARMAAGNVTRRQTYLYE
jgi:hypothetical protein